MAAVLAAWPLACRDHRAKETASADPPPVEAGVRALPSSHLVSDAGGLTSWPVLHEDGHCASLQKIAGYVGLVPEWTSDAGYLTSFDGGVKELLTFGDDMIEHKELDDSGHHVRGKEIPSGFATCEYEASTAVSKDWIRVYRCTAGPAPSPSDLATRYSELSRIWERCFKPTSLVRTPPPFPLAKTLTFAPLPAGQRKGCTLALEPGVLTLACFVGEND